jgi:hypothetical protein
MKPTTLKPTRADAIVSLRRRCVAQSPKAIARELARLTPRHVAALRQPAKAKRSEAVWFFTSMGQKPTEARVAKRLAEVQQFLDARFACKGI